MARSGRKRAAKARHPGGRVIGERPDQIVGTVLAQPHRRGDMDQLCASALGPDGRPPNHPLTIIDGLIAHDTLRPRLSGCRPTRCAGGMDRGDGQQNIVQMEVGAT